MKSGNHLKAISAISESIRNGQVKPVYLLSGDEDYFVFEARRQISEVLRGLKPSASEQVIDGDNTTMQSVVNMLRSPSLFNPFQIIIVRDALWFDTGKATQIDALKDWIASGSISGSLILTASSVDKRLSVTKLIKKSGEHLDFPKSRNFNQYDPKTDDYFPIVQERLRSRNQIIEGSAWKCLRQMTSDSLWAVINAIDVVSAYAGSNLRITITDITKCISDHSDMPGYIVVQALGDRDPARIKDTLEKTLEDGTHPLQITKSLSNRVRAFLAALSAGLDRLQLPPQYFTFRDNLLPELLPELEKHPVAREVLASMNPYALYQLLQQCRKFNMTELSACLESLARVDKSLKSSSTQALGLIEMALYPICNIRRSSS